MNYSVLLFDADNTLLDFTKTEQHAFIEVMKKHGYPYDVEVKKAYDTINHDLWKQFERGEITREEVVNSRFGNLFKKIGIVGDGVAFEKEYQEMLSHGCFVIEGAMELLGVLKQKGYRVYIVTNGVASTQHRRLSESGIESYVDGIFISDELGCQKPAKQFFDIVFAAAGEEYRKESLIIGDSLTSDIMGGNNAGIKSCWYNPNEQENESKAVPDYTIRNLNELYGILGINMD